MSRYDQRQTLALERIAEALEGLIIMTTPPKAATSAPQMITTPAPQFPPVDRGDVADDHLADDEVEPLNDDEEPTDEHA